MKYSHVSKLKYEVTLAIWLNSSDVPPAPLPASGTCVKCISVSFQPDDWTASLHYEADGGSSTGHSCLCVLSVSGQVGMRRFLHASMLRVSSDHSVRWKGVSKDCWGRRPRRQVDDVLSHRRSPRLMAAERPPHRMWWSRIIGVTRTALSRHLLLILGQRAQVTVAWSSFHTVVLSPLPRLASCQIELKRTGSNIFSRCDEKLDIFVYAVGNGIHSASAQTSNNSSHGAIIRMTTRTCLILAQEKKGKKITLLGFYNYR